MLLSVLGKCRSVPLPFCLYPNNMSYMNALWIKIANSYSKWPPLACTQFLSVCGHPSIELCNTATGKSAAAFGTDHSKLSIWGYLYLQAISWSLDLNLYSKGFRSRLAEGQSEVEMKSGTFVSSHWWVVRTLCGGAESCRKLSSVHGRGCCKKRHSNIESLKRSLRKAAAGFPVDVLHNSTDGWPQRLRTVCMLMVAILNNYLWFWFIMYPCSSCY